MKNLFYILVFFVGNKVLAQSDSTFNNPKDVFRYAYSNTDFSKMSSNYFTDFMLDLNKDKYNRFYTDNPTDSKKVEEHDLLNLLGFLEWWDMSEKFKRDSILYPLIDRIYSYSGDKSLHLPLIVLDYNVVSLNEQKRNKYLAHTAFAPFEELLDSETIMNNIILCGLPFENLGTRDVYLDFDDNFIFGNTRKTIVSISIRQGERETTLLPNESIYLNDFLTQKEQVVFTLLFSDSTEQSFSQLINLPDNTIAKSFGGLNTFYREYTNPTIDTDINNPEAQVSFIYACEDKKVRKPFFIVSGWGPHTDKWLINDNQEWPASKTKLYVQFNQEGLLENASADGFDIVFVTIFPPNASILHNANLLEKVINSVNTRKFQNGSYEENVIMGMSAGALAIRLALQQMEKKHLEQNGPHPHTKLFISNDGENGGANVPLGMQHAVEYLWQYEYNNFATDFNTYALRYILNAPLSKELLHYFHSASGSGNNPGQGPDIKRTGYLQQHAYNNHSKNGHLPMYPSFQRNISISMGSSTPNYNLNNYSSSHSPYPEIPGSYFFKQHGSMMGWVNRNFGASFLKHGINRVFYFEFKPLAKAWRVRYEAKTNNPLVLDNAPGGIIFIKQNPLVNINNELQSELSGAPEISEDYLFSFTPTVLTHDVKNLSSNLVNGYPNYNFKENRLMYDHEYNANPNIDLPSNFYGYPHLGHPGSHYDITPFDALFTWDQNTEHLIGNLKDPNAYAGMYSTMKPVLKNFIISEAEAFNIMLQNIRIGFFSRPGYIYKVDYEATNGIYMGNHVTQKTDFYDFSVESNADVSMQAVNEIVFKPGVHIKAGCKFHAYIGEIFCEKSGIVLPDENSNVGNKNDENFGRNETTYERDSDKISAVNLYPNPAKHSFRIQSLRNPTATIVEYKVFDMKGIFIQQGRVENNKMIECNLASGIYLVKINIENVCYSKKLIIE